MRKKMIFAWIETTPGYGPIASGGLNRGAVDGELEGVTDWAITGIHGMDDTLYKVVDNVFTPLSRQEVAAIKESEAGASILRENASKAKGQQDVAVAEYAINIAKKTLGLEVQEATIDDLKTYVQTLEADIQNPSSDPAYHPPLPPGVVVEDIPIINITMTRPEGWNSVLGWKMVFDIPNPEYIPANIAISVYTSANCTDYLYTPGALQHDTETGKYYATCPAGQEGGDVDYHFGLLYGSAQLSCWTFAAGTQEEVKQIYGEV